MPKPNEPGAQDDGNKGPEKKEKDLPENEGGESSDENEGSEGDEEDDEGDGSKLTPEQSAKLIKKLRAENAKHRTQNKTLGKQLGGAKKALIEAGIIEDDSADPEEKIRGLTAHASNLEVKNAILEACVENGVGKESKKYFEFLVKEELEGLQDGEELSDERLAELALEAGARGKSAKSTSVGNGKGKGKDAGNPPPPEGGAKDEVTYEQFLAMNLMDRSALMNKNPDLCTRYMKEARAKNQLVK